MSQHDYNLANQTFPSMRTDKNAALVAMATNNSGASAPATTFSYMWYADTTNAVMKQRNAANDAWHTLWPLDNDGTWMLRHTATPQGAKAAWFKGQMCLDTTNNVMYMATAADGTTGGTTWVPVKHSAVNSQTGTTYTYLATDFGKLVTHTNAASIAGTLPQATTAGFGAGFWMDVHNRGVGTLTITPTTSTVDGASSLVLTAGQGCRIYSDGTNYFTQRGVGGGGMTLLATATANASASVDFTTGIDSTYDHYILTGNLIVPQNGGAHMYVRVSENGGSSFVSTSSYAGAISQANEDGTQGVVQSGNSTTQFHIGTNLASTATANTSFVIEFFNPSNTSRYKTFIYRSTVMSNQSTAYYFSHGGGVYLSANAFNAIQILMSTGNVSSGNFYLYGVKKA